MIRRSRALVTVALLLVVMLPWGSAGAGPRPQAGGPTGSRAAPAGPVAGAPTVVSYQGRVTVNSQPFDGAGYFKFALVDQAGTTSYWSNDGTSTGGSQPAASVTLGVSSGLFAVLLGDTGLTGMTQALDDSAFSGIDRRHVRWRHGAGSECRG